jgi:carbon monoxide dehydrogenase subunit G
MSPPNEKGAPMKLEGSFVVPATQEHAWNFISDPLQVGECGPGVTSVEALDNGAYRAVARIHVGPFGATFNIGFSFLEAVEPRFASIKAEGSAPGAAFTAIATMELQQTNGETTVTWTADVAIRGALASVGARVMDATVRKLMSQTVACIGEKLGNEGTSSKAETNQ